ncbi:MAG: guanylate kinase [Clostridia bacterium]|nr:guanylate kinase [Clostridia bacterium]
MNSQRNILIVISGPSGVGKGTIVNRLMGGNNNMVLSVSCTTRQPREGEQDGVSYFFVKKERFMQMIERGELLEYSAHFDNYYGTPKSFVEDKLKRSDVLLEIEVDGALQVKKSHPEAVLIMLLPPSEGELERRLKNRGTESEEKIAQRVSRVKYELSRAGEYDYRVVNDDLDVAVQQIKDIIRKEKEIKI